MNGFSKSKIETTGIHINRFRQGIGSIQSDESNGNMEESLRSKTETKIIFKILKKITNKILDISKKGDSLKAWYIKN
jgi:RecA/RadA recombinase